MIPWNRTNGIGDVSKLDNTENELASMRQIFVAVLGVNWLWYLELGIFSSELIRVTRESTLGPLTN